MVFTFSFGLSNAVRINYNGDWWGKNSVGNVLLGEEMKMNVGEKRKASGRRAPSTLWRKSFSNGNRRCSEEGRRQHHGKVHSGTGMFVPRVSMGESLRFL